ncbi:MAG: CBS domain-containing protein [Erysipelotrichaceae bacterium]|nr:CBS domain-containing protein [Erysipelotrichaceae bacterium]
MISLFNFLTPKVNTFYLDYDSTIRQTLEKFDVHMFSVVPLVDENGKFISTISEGDILRFIKNSCKFDMEVAESVKISSLEKHRPYKALSIDTDMEDVIRLSSEQNFVPIVDDRGVYIGIIKRKDIIDYLFKDMQFQQ